MWPNRQIPADLVIFTEEILIFLCSVYYFINFKRRLWIARNFPETVRFHKISTQEN